MAEGDREKSDARMQAMHADMMRDIHSEFLESEEPPIYEFSSQVNPGLDAPSRSQLLNVETIDTSQAIKNTVEQAFRDGFAIQLSDEQLNLIADDIKNNSVAEPKANKNTEGMEYSDLERPASVKTININDVATLDQSEMLYARPEQIDIKALRAGIPDFDGKVTELSSNARVLATEHVYREAEQKKAAYENALSEKYKDAPELKTGADTNRDGHLSDEEVKGLATIAVLNHGVFRVEESEKKQLSALRDSSYDAAHVFFAAIREESAKLFPEGTYRQQVEIGNGFHKLRKDEQAQIERSEKLDAPSRDEALKEGQFVAPMNPAIKTEPEKGAEVSPPAATR